MLCTDALHHGATQPLHRCGHHVHHQRQRQPGFLWPCGCVGSGIAIAAQCDFEWMWLGKLVNFTARRFRGGDDVVLHIQSERTIVYTAAADGIAIKAQALQTLALGRRHLRQRLAVVQTHLLKQFVLLRPLSNQHRAQTIA